MKKIRICISVLLLLLSSFAAWSQRAYVRQKIERDMEKKYAEPQKKRGKAEIEKITYENDKRYKNPNNKVQATVEYETRDYDKKGRLKTTKVDKIIFGLVGECMVMDAGNKNETWMVYNYADKANYMVNKRDNTAIKMPLINMKKMAEKMAKKDAEMAADDNIEGWATTNETKNINGYNCKKYIYTYKANPHLSKMDAWVTNELKLNIGDNYVLGARINTYKFPDSKKKANLPNGFVILSVTYNNKENMVSERALKSINYTAEQSYFDMSPFKIIDVLDALD